jgi:hypothetical protein
MNVAGVYSAWINKHPAACNDNTHVRATVRISEAEHHLDLGILYDRYLKNIYIKLLTNSMEQSPS